MEKSPHFDLQFLREIKVKFDDFWFRGIVLKFSFIIYHFPNFYHQFIVRFDQIRRDYHKFPNSLWIRPLFTIIPLNSRYFHQIGKFGLCFDTKPCEIDDHSVLSRQSLNEIFHRTGRTCKRTNRSIKRRISDWRNKRKRSQSIVRIWRWGDSKIQIHTIKLWWNKPDVQWILSPLSWKTIFLLLGCKTKGMDRCNARRNLGNSIEQELDYGQTEKRCQSNCCEIGVSS